ncbi:MAG: hypothetical protein V3T67_02980 [Nitrosopumilaceae archaeon]
MLKQVPKSKDFFSQHPKIIKTQPKITSTRKEEDVFKVYNQSIENYFNSVKKNTAVYLQSVTDLQEKIIDSWQKSMNSAITLQKKFAQESNTGIPVPDATIKLINNLAAKEDQTQALQNKILLSSIEVIRQNIKCFNDNLITFTELNRKIVQSGSSQVKMPQIRPPELKSTLLEFRRMIQDVQVRPTPKSKRR